MDNQLQQSKKPLIVLFGCVNNTWPINTTPIQRANYLAGRYEVIGFDTVEPVSPFLEQKIQFIHVSKWSDIIRVLPRVSGIQNRTVLFWSGPSSRHILLAARLARQYQGNMVVDLFDSLYLPYGIAKARGHYCKALLYKCNEFFMQHNLRSCDLLIRAICVDPQECPVDPRKQVSLMNGVCQEAIQMGMKGMEHQTTPELLKAVYVGHCDRERSGLLLHMARRIYKLPFQVELHLMGTSDPSFISSLQAVTKTVSNLSVKAYGLVEWCKVMEIIEQSDVCLYPFPPRPELDCVYPIKLGEYLAMGKPVVSTPLSGAKAMAGDSDTVCFASYSNPDAWIDALERIYGNRVQQNIVASKARHRAAQLNWETIHQNNLQPRLDELFMTTTHKHT
jgi:glycosyltransferase involved in cell wall biosynthesis